MSVRVTVRGERALVRAMRVLPVRTKRTVARKGVAAGASVMNKGLKRAAPDKFVRKSIGRRRKTYTNTGTVLEAVGPRYNYRDEDGALADTRAVELEFGDENTPARPFMRPGFSANAPAARSAIEKKIGDEIAKEAAKLMGGGR